MVRVHSWGSPGHRHTWRIVSEPNSEVLEINCQLKEEAGTSIITGDEHCLETKDRECNLEFKEPNHFIVHLRKLFSLHQVSQKGTKTRVTKTQQCSASTAQPPHQIFICVLFIIQTIHYYYLCCHSVLEPESRIKTLMRWSLWKL